MHGSMVHTLYCTHECSHAVVVGWEGPSTSPSPPLQHSGSHTCKQLPPLPPPLAWLLAAVATHTYIITLKMR